LTFVPFLNIAQMDLINKIKINFYWLPSSVMICSAILKFGNLSFMNELNNTLELQDKWVYIGVIELVSVIFFLFKPTMLIGFFLICAFWGGVLSASIIAHRSSFGSISILLSFGLALYWRKPTLFTSQNFNQKT
jgi:hypothetical protein